MKLLKWLFINGIFSTLVYFGVVQGNEGIGNIVMFWVFTLGAVSLLFTHSGVVEKNKNLTPSVPRQLDGMFDIAVISTFVYFGWWFTAAAYLVHFIMLIAFWEKVQERNKNEN